VIFPGKEAFILHDRYVFPIDLIQQMCREKGIELDMEGYERLMQEQRERSRQDRKRKAM
jgi:alanyl-tRNA synthetase